MPHFVIATAGHVDHGKSALVQALTGTDPDRLPEEKARGITIQLGFAHFSIPARFAIGVTIPADKDEGAIAGYHCWAEFLAEGKWVPVDISEAAKNPALGEYYFGHHPANRFELSVGRDLVVDPAPASGPINFLIYPLFEIGGEVARTETEFAFRRAKE